CPGAFLDLDAPRPWPLGRRNRDLEHAVREGRLRLFGVDPVGQRYRAVEGPVAPFAPVEAASPILALVTPLPRNDELVVLHFQLDLIAGQARDIRSDDELAFPFEDVQRGHPHRFPTFPALGFDSRPETGAEALGEAIQILEEATHQAERTVRNCRHA